VRKIFRDVQNQAYWDDRWSSAGVDKDKFENLDIYPIKYTNMVLTDKSQKILECGCGSGRVFFHYKNMGYDITGVEYSQNAVDNILAKDPSAKVIQGSVTELPYEDGSFDVFLALGLYHNIEDLDALDKSFEQSARVMKKGGRILLSVRHDSMENRILEYIVRSRKKDKNYDKFHRWHFDEESLNNYLTKHGLTPIGQMYARNVSFLFKFDIFRASHLKSDNFVEAEARSGGFRLNWLGNAIDKTLHFLFPKEFSNITIVIAQKD